MFIAVFLCAFVSLCLCVSPIRAQAPQLPTEIAPVRFNSGQSVVPYFEGWLKNPDGTFDFSRHIFCRGGSDGSLGFVCPQISETRK